MDVNGDGTLTVEAKPQKLVERWAATTGLMKLGIMGIFAHSKVTLSRK